MKGLEIACRRRGEGRGGEERGGERRGEKRDKVE